ncbi:MAG: hypothetical protein S4CHLAM6_00540 [Chlamydiae bacterium]|nr:hypothetical protein [Chlamydiota bacterium]
MKKYLLILSFLSVFAFAQQPVEITYDAVNREFQAQLQKLFQDFTDQQASQGNEVLVNYYDNMGEVRVSSGTAGAPSYLRTISNYKVQFMRERQLTSTKGVVCSDKVMSQL